MEELFDVLAKYGIGAIFGGIILWLWQRDQKKFEDHLKEDTEKERGMREQAEKDRDRMIDVAITSTTAISDLRHDMELDRVRREPK